MPIRIKPTQVLNLRDEGEEKKQLQSKLFPFASGAVPTVLTDRDYGLCDGSLQSHVATAEAHCDRVSPCYPGLRCGAHYIPGPLTFVGSSIQPMMSSSAGPGHVAAAADAERKDGPRESHSLGLLRPLPGAQQSAGLPS